MRYLTASLVTAPEFWAFSRLRIVNGKGDFVVWLRRGMLELWAMVVLAVVVGFLGPFGTYNEAEFPLRVWAWFMHLMGAYVLVRPTISLLSVIADATSLPRTMLLFWGVLLSGFPLALVWTWGASVFFHALGGFGGILPFAVLSAAVILIIVAWAGKIDERVVPPSAVTSASERRQGDIKEVDQVPGYAQQGGNDPQAVHGVSADGNRPRLEKRLSSAFRGPIMAIQSEDHYVRVHGNNKSELLLMRLRDAIAELDDMPGQQVHRSWWVAKSAIASVAADGRNRTIFLVNGQSVPVARDSISSLERIGFI